MTLSVATAEPRSPRAAGPSTFVRRLLRKPLAVGCVALLAAICVVAIVAPILLPSVAGEHAGDLAAVHHGPSARHLLGTDTLGRDILDRLLVGTRITVIGIGEALLTVLVLGLPLGLVSGYVGGVTDRIVGWLADLAFALPAIVIVIAVLTVFPYSMSAAMITFGAIAAPGLMRVVRSATLAVREELYVAAARVSGLSRSRIIARHVLPRIKGPVIVQASLLSAVALLVQSGLGFLNLVVHEPAPSWGGMIADGSTVIDQQPWLIVPPGLAIALTILALGLLGDVVRDTTAEAWSPPVRPQPRRPRPGPVTEPSRTGRTDALLSVAGLSVAFGGTDGAGGTTVVQDVSFDIAPGEAVGLVGESGCGKSVTATSILGLLPGTARITAGRVVLDGRDLTALPERELRRVRGGQIGFVSQQPMTSLNPAFRVGWQLREVVRRHGGRTRGEAEERVVDLLRQVRIPDPQDVVRRYPHQLSGGMAQRVAIARALAGEPRLLIADEPTTALDVRVQAEILDLLRDLQEQRRMGLLLVTHDWGVVADLCARAIVMYAGEVVECADVRALFRTPLHPYTEALLAANPQRVSGSEPLPVIPGTVPAPADWPVGCRFTARCRYAKEDCADGPVALERPDPARVTRCRHYEHLVRS